MIAFDTTALSLVWVPGATARNRRTQKPIKYAKERLEALIDRIAADDDVILIPTPVLSEVIVKIPSKAHELIEYIRSSPWFRVESFDAAAALELGLRTEKAISDGDKREGINDATWTKIKFDRQIISIAMVNNASKIISDDGDIAAIGERCNFPVKSIGDLPIPEHLIPPPLLAKLEEEDENEGTSDTGRPEAPQPVPSIVPGGHSRHPDNQSAVVAAEKFEDEAAEKH